MKAGGENALQHVLKKQICEGDEPSESRGAAGHGLTVIWLTQLENGPEELSIEGGRGKTSREKFKNSISDNLQAW